MKTKMTTKSNLNAKVPPFSLGEDMLTWSKLVELSRSANPLVKVSDSSWKKLLGFRAVVESALAENRTIYGINTGFGYLSDVRIKSDDMKKLQVNLIRSHACGYGDNLTDEQARGLLILRAHTFLLGHSGISRATVEKILEFLRLDVLPVVPVKGSVGASGDLAPLAHLALGLLGEGQLRYDGQTLDAKIVLAKVGLSPLEPNAKEGLSLINGTQFMTALGAFAMEKANLLLEASNVAACLSLDAIKGTPVAFDPKIHSVRKQYGQSIVAKYCRDLLTDDEIVKSHESCQKVQDPYSFRCVPQVHGASYDVLNYVQEVLNRELNSVTDNPLVFIDGDVISGGNFHGQPIAMAFDFLAIAIAELGSISERRTEKLTNPAMSGLPAFIVKDGGLNSGFMIPHVVAAALVSENKILCHPASVDSIPTSADKEDHVSMGPIAVRKALDVCVNVQGVLGVELIAACQAIDFHSPLKPSKPLAAIYDKVRTMVSYMDQDRSIHRELDTLAKWIGNQGVRNVLSEFNLTLPI